MLSFYVSSEDIEFLLVRIFNTVVTNEDLHTEVRLQHHSLAQVTCHKQCSLLI